MRAYAIKTLATAVLAATLFVVSLPAQMPGGPPPGGEPTFTELKAYLTLTDAQVQALLTLRQREMEATRTFHEQMGAKQNALQQLLQSGSTDAAAVGRAMLEIEALRKQVEQTHKNYRDQALATLTADQRTKLAALEQAVRLQPVIGQAAGIGLLEPPFPGGPGGPGVRMMVGPGGPGFAPHAGPPATLQFQRRAR